MYSSLSFNVYKIGNLPSVLILDLTLIELFQMSLALKEEEVLNNEKNSRIPQIVPKSESIQQTDFHYSSKRHSKSVYYQIILSITANLTILSSGMVLGFPAISLNSLQNKSYSVYLNDEEASWFGK